jgi:hypothetical protein
MPRTVVLFTTHVLNPLVEAHYRKLRIELPAGWDLLLFYDEGRLSRRSVTRVAGNAVLPHDNESWKRFKRPGRFFPEKIPGNEDGLLFSAMDRLPDYAWYWYIEYDMAFSGNWRTFFDAWQASDSDILAVNMIRRTATPDWPLWKSMEPPEDEGPDTGACIRAHHAISRLSRRTLEVLRPIYQLGWAGHSEALLTTLAARNGLKVEDIGGDGEFVRPVNINRFYRSTPTSNTLGPGTLVFRPAMEAPGDEPNMLWHPVKKASRFDWDREPGRARRLWNRVSMRARRLVSGGPE